MSNRSQRFHMISWVAERYEIHPQTLRLYEREGLILPTRSVGNTRLYDDETCKRLEFVLTLTRDLGVNLAGVEIVLNMREKMEAMQREFERFFEYLRNHASEISSRTDLGLETEALIPVSRFRTIRTRQNKSDGE